MISSNLKLDRLPIKPTDSLTVAARPENFASAFACYAVCGVSGRHRVRGKDCVPLKCFEFSIVASMNSFLPELADTGRNG